MYAKSYLPAALKPKSATNQRFLLRLRRLSSVPHLQSPLQPPPPEEPSVVAQVITQLQANEDWNSDTKLRKLLFPSTNSLPPQSLYEITRSLGTTDQALKFFQFVRTNSPDNASLSSTFEAFLELSTREKPNSSSSSSSSQLLALSKELNVPLTANAGILLIKYFSHVGKIEESVLVYNQLDSASKRNHVRNVLVDALLKYDRFDDALQLLDEMPKPDGFTIDIVMRALLRRNWIGRSVSEKEERLLGFVTKFCENGVFPKTRLFTQLITKLCRCYKVDKAWELLHDMLKLGKLEAASCNALLSGLSRKGDFTRMNLLLKEMKENNIQPDVVTFGFLVNHLCKNRRVDDALDAFKKMMEGSDGISIKPDVILFNTLIDGLCKVGRQEEGLALMEEMRSQHDCSPTTATYNCLIDGFCKSGEIERSLELFNQMKEADVEPNVITLNTLVDGMSKNGRVNKAMEFFRAMQEKGLKGNVVTYSALITAFCNANNIDKAIQLFHEMGPACPPDAVVYYSLISGLSQAGRLDDASLFASKMKEAGFGLDIVCYNTLIGGFCRKKKLDKAVDMLNDMEQAGVKPDGITYNTLISFFSENGDFETAHKIMTQMIENGHVPTVITYGSLIHAYCLAGNIDHAMKVFNQMERASKVPPNTVIYNILVDSLCKKDKVEDALFLMDEMKRKGVRPNTTTFNAIFKGLWDRNWLKEAYRLMDQMISQACAPDYITMEILTDWFSEVGELEKLKRFMQGYDVSSSTA